MQPAANEGCSFRLSLYVISAEINLLNRVSARITVQFLIRVLHNCLLCCQILHKKNVYSFCKIYDVIWFFIVMPRNRICKYNSQCQSGFFPLPRRNESAHWATGDPCGSIGTAVQEGLRLLWKCCLAGSVLQVLERRVPESSAKADPGGLGPGWKVSRAVMQKASKITFSSTNTECKKILQDIHNMLVNTCDLLIRNLRH